LPGTHPTRSRKGKLREKDTSAIAENWGSVLRVTPPSNNACPMQSCRGRGPRNLRGLRGGGKVRKQKGSLVVECPRLVKREATRHFKIGSGRKGGKNNKGNAPGGKKEGKKQKGGHSSRVDELVSIAGGEIALGRIHGGKGG